MRFRPAPLVVALIAIASLAGAALAAKSGAEKAEKKAQELADRRSKTDSMAKELVATVAGQSADAKRLSEKAYGWAAFDNTKVALGISGGGGHGVAVVGQDGARTYMKMGTVGVGFGLGAQKYQVLFLFENKEVFDAFVGKGWQGGAGATAAAGTEGANAAATFHDGIAVFTMTEKGLMANADVSGTKYWKDDKLND